MSKYEHLSFAEMEKIAKESTKICRCSEDWGALHIHTSGDYYIVWDGLQEHEGHTHVTKVDLSDIEDVKLIGKIKPYGGDEWIPVV